MSRHTRRLSPLGRQHRRDFWLFLSPWLVGFVLFRYLKNTVIVVGCVVFGTLISSSLCAYAFAFCQVPYRKYIFYGVLATMMLPAVVTMIPRFILFREVGWFDTFKPLIVPAFFGNAFAIFLFRQFFLGLPKELIEAVHIDGATNLQIYWRIVMPLSRPVCVTVAIFAFMGAWNDFMGLLIFLNSQENWTLQLGLSSFIGQTAAQWHLLMAMTVMVLLPVLLVSWVAQNRPRGVT
jgi:ABC-type glycerol-3-phosphate transport system permease component